MEENEEVKKTVAENGPEESIHSVRGPRVYKLHVPKEPRAFLDKAIRRDYSSLPDVWESYYAPSTPPAKSPFAYPSIVIATILSVASLIVALTVEK